MKNIFEADVDKIALAGHHIQVVFENSSKDSRLRVLITQPAIQADGIYKARSRFLRERRRSMALLQRC
jgi:hypothetical protein